jgi:hypothetical protein
MNESAILEFVNVFCAGLLAGAEYIVCFGLRGTITVLDQQPHFQLRQALIRRLRVVVPAVYVPTALSGIAVTVLNGTGGGFGLRCAGLLAVLIWTLTTFLGTVPINAAMLAWRPDAPPHDWTAIVSNWERLDIIRFWAAATTFVFFLAAVAQKTIILRDS